MRLLKSDLLRKFAVYSLLAFSLTGIGLSIIISRHIVTDAINGKIDVVRFALNSAVNSVQPDSTPELLEHLRTNLQFTGATDFFLWDSSGMMVGRSIQGLVDKSLYELSFSMLTDTSDHQFHQYTDSTDAKWLLLKLPVSGTGVDIRYTVTIRFPYSEIEAHQNMLIRNIIYSISGGLSLLYLLLIRVIDNASRTLTQQREHLDSKNIELENAYAQLNTAFHATVQALADAVDARDPYTAGHVNRVMDYATRIGHEMRMDAEGIHLLTLAAQLHDIGKIGIPDAVLLKPDSLTNAEYEIIKSHSDIGTAILKNVPDFTGILPAVRHHHERYDGKGYPSGLGGTDIPLAARIIAIADAYDAMTTNRPYRHSIGVRMALQELLRGRGTQFDPEVTDAFLRLMQTSAAHQPAVEGMYY